MKVLLILLRIFILRRNNDHILTDSKFVELQDAQLIRHFFRSAFPLLYISPILKMNYKLNHKYETVDAGYTPVFC